MTDSSFTLIRKKRFGPFFFTQFLGAFNDNMFKQALVVIISFTAIAQVDMGAGADSAKASNTLNNIAAALFILPFFLFSALAGQVADKFEKSMLIRHIKLAEVFIMCFAALGFMLGNLNVLLFVLFLMGAQSTFFGPIKYSIIPQHLDNTELVGGNALVEMGTFLAIIFGYIAGVLLVGDSISPAIISIGVIMVALLGWQTAHKIPEASAASPELGIDWNIFRQTWHTVQYANTERAVLLSVVGISWFWFLGAAYMTQLPIYVRENLHGTPGGVYILLLTTFSVGVALGSLLCERLSGHRVELGLVPLGSLGLSLFGLDLFIHYQAPQEDVVSASAFLSSPANWRTLVDFLGIGISGGLYIVPLFAVIQERTQQEFRARVIAANNILNALFMVASAAFGIVLIGVMDLNIPQFFAVLAICNVVVALFIFTVVPEFAMRFIVWMITHTMWRVNHVDLEKVPEEGPCVLVCNHVSYADAMIIGGALRRPVRFVMYKPIYQLPVLNFVFRTGKAIPIDSKGRDPEAYESAFARIKEELDAGEVVCIFPEGKLTTTGEIDEFKSGIDKILATSRVPVVPMALRGLWGSFFSHKGGPAMTRPPKRFCSKIDFIVGDPVAAEEATSKLLFDKVSELHDKNISP